MGVALDDDRIRYGRVSEVTDDKLTIWERHGAAAISRDHVARLAVRTPIGSSRAPNIVKWSLVGAVITGALAWFASSMEENPHDDGGKWMLFFGGAATGGALGSQLAPVDRYRDRVVYIRP